MKKLIASGLAVLLVAASASLLAQQPAEKDEPEPSIWMKQKMKYTQEILVGLATEDFDKIQQNATSMKGLNRIEYFVRRRPEGYRTQLKTFQFGVDELLRHAKDENLDGATLAFTQITVSCVNCHKHLRQN